LVGLQLVEPSDAGFHLLGSERFRSHAGSPIRFWDRHHYLEGRHGLLRLAGSRFKIVHQSQSSSQHNWLTATDRHRDRVSAGAGATRRGRHVGPGAVARGRGLCPPIRCWRPACASSGSGATPGPPWRMLDPSCARSAVTAFKMDVQIAISAATSR